MKIFILIISILFLNTLTYSQDTKGKDSLKSANNTLGKQVDNSKINDTLKHDSYHNMYGDLLNDDPAYNKKYPIWIPAARVFLANGFTLAVDRFVSNYDFSHISTESWKHNIKSGWEWDADRFGINFIGHPYSGNNYFNIARSNGYTYLQSFPFTVEGSLMWEFFGETTLPSKNDLINTTISGSFLGEVLYRLSSNILDDRKKGSERVRNEILAGLLDPTRALNRLTQGKMKRVTTIDVYQKEPLNLTLFGGIHKVNVNNQFGTGATNEMFNIQFDYGDPFEKRSRKPFDVFRLRTEFSLGVGRKIIDNVTGYGILLGKTTREGRQGFLIGGFQHYDYWDNKLFELGSIGFGVGIIARTPVQQHSNIYSAVHFAIVPLAGNSTRYGPDSSQFRDYNFGGGLEGKIEETFNINQWASSGFTGYYYYIHTYSGLPGNSLLGIIKPKLSIQLYKNLSVGFEQQIYHNDRYLNHVDNLHVTRTEQKFYLLLYLEDARRKGKYN